MTAVFISSTSINLQPYRAAVRRACDELSLGMVDMKDFEAADLDAVRAVERGIERLCFLLDDAMLPTWPDDAVCRDEPERLTAFSG